MSTAESAATNESLPKAYRPADVEAELYARWLAADVFAPDGAGSRADPSKPPFVITQPPPNVTGALHLGHAQRTSVEDALIRHARMTGRPTLWVPGVDHASIAAQVVLDRLLAREGESRASLGRERYLERMWQFMDETRDVIARQHERLGASADWSRLRFTMDEDSARAVRVAFKRLYDDGLAYRTEALVNWCPGCRTSVSDLEVIPRPQNGTLWTVRYHLLDDAGSPRSHETIAVATTRPETILGDTAVAVHPDDERYRALVGQRALIPFVDRPVPIIADEAVDPSFGTGAVKVTPAHDQTDYEIGRRHGLPMVTVLDDSAAINENGGWFAGLDRFEARRRIVAALDERGDLADTRPHELSIGHCERSDDIVEPRLKTQWFVRTRPLAQRALESTRSGRTQIVPSRFVKVWEHWMTNIRDWNVSRQLWWGHRIPAWYCPDGHPTVSDAPDGPNACAECGRPAAELTQDPDIFDTWFSSGLWPFSTLGWPDDTPDYRRFYPTTVMETAYDIIFFWVARMMMLGLHLTDREPFTYVYLSGLVRDPHGRKFSKTKGITIDPLETIEQYGADALRFALIEGVAPGADARLGEAKLEGARNFGNKLWNAARFVLGARPPEMPPDVLLSLPDESSMGPAERWILARCAATIADVTRAYENLAVGDAARVLHEAIWSEYCDWYLELAKATLRGGSDAAVRVATWQTLTWVLDRYLRLLHPLMPFITETIWARLPHAADDPELLIVARWPDAAATAATAGDGAALEPVFELVREIRNARSEAGVEAGAWLDAAVWLADPESRVVLAGIADAMAPLARSRLRPVDVRDELDAGAAPGAITVATAAGEARLSLPAADRARERERLDRELADARRLLAVAESRIANESFVAKAPPEVVAGARARAAELRDLVARIESRLA